MEVLRQITESDVPAHTLQVNIKRTNIKIKQHYRSKCFKDYNVVDSIITFFHVKYLFFRKIK